MNILRSIGFLAVMGLVGLGGIEIVQRAAVPGFHGVIATAHAGWGARSRPSASRVWLVARRVVVRTAPMSADQ